MTNPLDQFRGVLPYASELYGIYQPLIGWTSRLQKRRVEQGARATTAAALDEARGRYRPEFNVGRDPADAPEYRLGIAAEIVETRREGAAFSSLVGERAARAIAENGPQDPQVWAKFTSDEFLSEALGEIDQDIRAEYAALLDNQIQSGQGINETELRRSLAGILARESLAAAQLRSLGQASQNMAAAAALGDLLAASEISEGTRIASILNWISKSAPRELREAALSPIGVVHLFRQFFFEFDTFLGPPVQHIWLSPGSRVELVEVSTRRTLVEQVSEEGGLSVQRAEEWRMTSDEFSEAVRQYNAANTRLGVTADTHNVYALGFINGTFSAGTSYNLETQRKQARFGTHKALRQQSGEIATEIRKSYRTTFRTVSETTDITSKKYVLANHSGKLLNYELRRKMRQVGVQVQDYGTHLCWQTHVDLPGDQLGVAEFVHAAKLPDAARLQDPAMIEKPPSFSRGESVTLNLQWRLPNERVPAKTLVILAPEMRLIPPEGHVYAYSEIKILSGPGWQVQAWPTTPYDTKAMIVTSIDEKFVFVGGYVQTTQLDARTHGFIRDVDAGGGTTEPTVDRLLIGIRTGEGGLKDDRPYDWTVEVTPVFRPGQKLLKSIEAENEKRRSQADAERQRAYQDAYYKTVRERLKLASRVQPRPAAELREEERTIIYRNLVQQLLKVAGIEEAEPPVWHLFAELVGSIFDMDRMLYFVAPEWWKPARQVSRATALRALGVAGGQSAAFGKANLVGWGGPRSKRDANYFITEATAPAKYGSSLGWLLQLDGDNLRNAFLNAPWVKAVLPIRPGQEWRALEWLSSDEIEGAQGLADPYRAGDEEKAAMLARLQAEAWEDAALAQRYAALGTGGLTRLDAIRHLILSVQDQQQAERDLISPAGQPERRMLPTDRVFETGFDPLQGGFEFRSEEHFAVFDQWVEILPTDQIVPVEVTYNPKTGRQEGE